MSNNALSIQEMAVNFANSIYNQLNQSIADTMGVDVMWFRAIPDKKNSDVIFQTYTLYGVEDCPLNFKAMYTDTGYDDAALTYNIMGISYAIPMSLEIPISTWKDITGNDGSIPQQYDVVFIPISQKLLEVASMTPVKKIGAQLTAYKVNLTAYKPKRSRIVGENLRESIEENTVNRDSLFSEEIEKEILNIVDDHQLDLMTSTTKDKFKDVATDKTHSSGVIDVTSIVSYNLIVDGHVVARNYYNTTSENDYTVRYNVQDTFTNNDTRTFSCWIRLNDIDTSQHIKNIKEMSLSSDKNGTYIITKLGTKFKKGDNVIIKRGMIKIPGVVVTNSKIKVNDKLIKKYNASNPSWINAPGFAVTMDNTTTMLKSDKMSISIKGENFISLEVDGKECLFQLSSEIKRHEWYGIMVTLGKTFSVDIFSSSGKLTQRDTISDIKNDLYTEIELNDPTIPSGHFNITNIRLCKGVYNNIDKKIKEFISYTVKNDSQYIINDDAMTFLPKEYVGRQR